MFKTLQRTVGATMWMILLAVSVLILGYGILNASILAAGMCFGIKPLPSYVSEWNAPGLMALSGGVSALPFMAAFALRPSHRMLLVYGVVVFAAIGVTVVAALLCPNPNLLG